MPSDFHFHITAVPGPSQNRAGATKGLGKY